MATNPKHIGFDDVDSSNDPQFFVKCLNEQYAKSPILRLCKHRTLEMADIQDGHMVLDVGCGTGVDAIQMATLVGQSGHVFGIDLSQEMILSAQKNAAAVDLPITFRCSSIYQLEFENSFFDRCRADKTFQHLSDPRAALKEMIRVTKPGGKIIIADPDHDSLIIDTPFTDVNQRFTRFRSAHMPQGGIAHQMYGICKELGLVNVYVDALTHVYTDYEEKKVTSPYLEEIWVAEQHGVVSHEEAEKWAAYVLEAIESERFMCMQTYVITMAMKPLHESNTA
jgi:ubiquinone/menaquinone biosynthesis C-methylase UbiE